MARRLLVGFVLVLVAAGCGASARPFDARATLACLRKRPEYHPAGQPQGLGFAFWSLDAQPTPLPARRGKGSGFDLMFTDASIPGGAGAVVVIGDLNFFDDAGAARDWRGRFLSHIDSARRSSAEQAVQRDRNLVVVWANGESAPPSRMATIVNGCVRVRSKS
jgi:hypothetical protein